MRFKKATAALLAAALAVPTMCITAYAEEDAAMKKALTYVKERMDIPEECSEFDYSTRSENNSKRYVFTWRLPDDTDYSTLRDGTYSNIRVEITGSVIKSARFTKYDKNGNWEASFAKLSDAKIMAAAKKYIDELNPTIREKTVIDEDSLNISLYGNYAYVNFHREYKGIPVTGQTGTVTIDKNSGELISYSYNWTNGASFKDPEGAISQSAAEEAYKSLFGSDIYYTVSYDWEKKEYIPHLLYTQNSTGQINAFTGKLSNFEDYDSYDRGDNDDMAEEAAYDNAAPTMASGANKAVTFTAEEIKKLEDESKLITARAALDKLAEYDFFLIPENCDIEWENCSYNERNGYYVRNVSFKAKLKDYYDLSGESLTPYLNEKDIDDNDYIWGSFSYNAETGELLSYNNYDGDNGTSISESKAKKIADTAAKKLMGDKLTKFASLEQTYANKRYLEYDPRTGRGIGTPITTSVSFSANREAYGIKCRDESYSITVNNNGYVSNFRCSYLENVEYPDPTNKVSADDAYKAFFDKIGISLKYRVAYKTDTKKIVSALVYSANGTLCVDALTGKPVNYDGSELTENTKGEYTDLEGSKYAKYAEKLAKYGIYLMDENGRLNENEAITAGDFNALISNVGIGWIDLQNTAIANIKEDTKLNRQTAAVLMVTSRFGKDVAELKGIYKSNFSDVSEDSKYVGYIAISDAAGLIKGNSSGKFLPKKAFSRGAALKLVYDILAKA